LEKGYLLYGRDVDESINPLEAGLEWTVRFDKGGFVGRQALLKAKDVGLRKLRIGLMVPDGRVLTPGSVVTDDAGSEVGRVTSAGYGPTIGRSIAMAYVVPEVAVPEKPLLVRSREDSVPAKVVRMPFYDPKNLRLKDPNPNVAPSRGVE
ncbi:MAG: hypothetical protein NUW23_16285, partial [Firmicutes bacterium]|nr:hypothetical protein [Bacillota bacterium]